MPILGRDFKPGAEEKIYYLKKKIEEQFPGLWKPTEACLSVVSQLLISDIVNCLLLVLVGVPASRKTTVLKWFSDTPVTYCSDDFTPSAFVSHYASATEKDLSKIDLLPRIKGKVLIVAELLPIFDAPYETLMHNMAIITRLLDGQGYTSDSGVHGRRGYTGAEGEYVFHWLGAIAFVPHHMWKLVGNMGPRIYFYLFPKEAEKDAKELAKELQENYKEKTTICKNAVHSYISYLLNSYPTKIEWEKEKDSSSACEMISNFALLLCRLRGNVEIHHLDDSDEESLNYKQPIVEAPHRANQVLYNYARGHAVLYGRRHITNEDVPLVAKIALNSANTDRVRLFEILISNNGKATTKELKEQLNCSANMAIQTMMALKVLGLIEIKQATSGKQGGRPMKIASIKPEFNWILRREFKEIFKA